MRGKLLKKKKKKKKKKKRALEAAKAANKGKPQPTSASGSAVSMHAATPNKYEVTVPLTAMKGDVLGKGQMQVILISVSVVIPCASLLSVLKNA